MWSGHGLVTASFSLLLLVLCASQRRVSMQWTVGEVRVGRAFTHTGGFGLFLFFFFFSPSSTFTYHLYLSLCSRSLCLPLSSTFPCTYVIHTSVFVVHVYFNAPACFFCSYRGYPVLASSIYISLPSTSLLFFTLLSFCYCS